MIIFRDLKLKKMLSVLIGEDNILLKLNKQMREARKYYDSWKACGMHKRDDNLLNINNGNNNLIKIFGNSNKGF